MAEFHEALAYSLLCVNQQNLVLKAKQEEALFHLYIQRSRCVRLVSRRLREVDLFPTYTVLINALASIVLTSVVSYKAAGR